MTGRQQYDLSGKKFGGLEAIEYFPEGPRRWLCRCDCGREVRVRTSYLTKSNGRFLQCKKCTDSRTSSERIIPDELSLKNIVFRRYLRQAKRKRIVFNLSFALFCQTIERDCWYCGAPPHVNRSDAYRRRSNTSFRRNGIDRIDSSNGYLPGNIRPCCVDCNRIKGNLSDEEFCRRIEKIHSVGVRRLRSIFCER